MLQRSVATMLQGRSSITRPKIYVQHLMSLNKRCARTYVTHKMDYVIVWRRPQRRADDMKEPFQAESKLYMATGHCISLTREDVMDYIKRNAAYGDDCEIVMNTLTDIETNMQQCDEGDCLTYVGVLDILRHRYPMCIRTQELLSQRLIITSAFLNARKNMLEINREQGEFASRLMRQIQDDQIEDVFQFEEDF